MVNTKKLLVWLIWVTPLHQSFLHPPPSEKKIYICICIAFLKVSFRTLNVQENNNMLQKHLVFAIQI